MTRQHQTTHSTEGCSPHFIEWVKGDVFSQLFRVSSTLPLEPTPTWSPSLHSLHRLTLSRPCPVRPHPHPGQLGRTCHLRWLGKVRWPRIGCLVHLYLIVARQALQALHVISWKVSFQPTRFLFAIVAPVGPLNMLGVEWAPWCLDTAQEIALQQVVGAEWTKTSLVPLCLAGRLLERR